MIIFSHVEMITWAGECKTCWAAWTQPASRAPSSNHLIKLIYEGNDLINVYTGFNCTYATEAKLDTKKFEECLTGGKYTAQVSADMREGMAAGVSGTPAYFINGIFVSGAQPYNKFAEIIDEELMTK